MRIAEVIGNVTLSQVHPSLQGAQLRLVVPLTTEDVKQSRPPQSDPIVAYDEMGTGIGSRILLSEGPEAAQPFRPTLKPVDAYIAGILDHLDIEFPKE
jgi:microcompartment protein CcmK/EutM